MTRPCGGSGSYGGCAGGFHQIGFPDTASLRERIESILPDPVQIRRSFYEFI